LSLLNRLCTNELVRLQKKLASAHSKDEFLDADVDASLRLGEAVSRWNHPDIRLLGLKTRDALGGIIATALNEAFKDPSPPPRAKEAAAELRATGRRLIPNALSASQSAEVETYFRDLPCYNLHYEGHINGDKIPRFVDKGAEEFQFGSYPRDDILRAPYLLELFSDDAVIDIVRDYLGARPMLYSVNAYWSFPNDNDEQSSYGQDFHRDISHPRFCVLFVCLTDTDQYSGAPQYILYTHNPDRLQEQFDRLGKTETAATLFDLPMDGLGFTKQYLEACSEFLETIEAQAGTAILEDTYGLHRGLAPIKRPRLMAWARYSLFTVPPKLEKTPRKILGSRYPTQEQKRFLLRGVVG